MPLPNYIPCMNGGVNPGRDQLVCQYFSQGMTYVEIVAFLLSQHRVCISLSTVKRILARLGIKRRAGKHEDTDEVRKIITDELIGSGKALGYRKMWKIIQSHGIPVRRSSVMEILRELDPEGVMSRKKKRLRRRLYSVPGPDYLWHIDGHDKLKPFGFSIHGCIDGFSRRLIWLEVGPTNKQPEVITNYFIQSVKQLGHLPTRIRSDDGTENSILEAVQIALRLGHSDTYAGINSFIIGTSPANQRIESFWSQLAKDRPIWWRQFFKELSDMGYLDADNKFIVECVRYCFMQLIRSDLEDLAVRWNQHIIASSKDATAPRGRPDTMYFVPELYSRTSYKKELDLDDLNEFCDPAFAIAAADNQPEFIEFAETVLHIKGFSNPKPDNVKKALEIYFILLEAIEMYT